MMRRGVLTVYLSIVSLLMISFVLILLESSRVYVIGTMTERYADMAGEMLFSAYVRPVADRYGLFVLDTGNDGGKLECFRDYLELNLEENASDNKRIFDMYGVVQEAVSDKTVSLKDQEWQALKVQIERYEKYSMGEQGIQGLKDIINQLTQTDLADVVEDYRGNLSSEGQSMDAALAEKQDITQEDGQDVEQVTPAITDPRPGIGRWLKSGLLEMFMDGKDVSERTIQISDCSYQIAEGKKWSIVDRFERYGDVTAALSSQDFLDKLKKGVTEQKTQMLINLYILEEFNKLCDTQNEQEGEGASVLAYETEYILYGHPSDRENLDSALTGIFTLRTLLNLVYLYSNQGKGEILEYMVGALSASAVIPVVGQVLKLLLMICWASAEAVVDCTALANNKKVPLMKNDNSWNLTMEQLLAIGKNGGASIDYVRDGTQGLTYENYLLIFLLFTSADEKITRMTQLMESNIRLIEGYEDFRFAKCITSAEFYGTVVIQPKLWLHPVTLYHDFHVEYSY